MVPTSTSFPVTLHRLLSEAEKNGKDDVISWMPDDESFKVHDRSKFATNVMSSYFGTSNYRSFQKNLNMWGFTSIRSGSKRGSYYHPLFVRKLPSLCHRMVRRRSFLRRRRTLPPENKQPEEVVGPKVNEGETQINRATNTKETPGSRKLSHSKVYRAALPPIDIVDTRNAEASVVCSSRSQAKPKVQSSPVPEKGFSKTRYKCHNDFVILPRLNPPSATAVWPQNYIDTTSMFLPRRSSATAEDFLESNFTKTATQQNAANGPQFTIQRREGPNNLRLLGNLQLGQQQYRRNNASAASPRGNALIHYPARIPNLNTTKEMLLDQRRRLDLHLMMLSSRGPHNVQGFLTPQFFGSPGWKKES